MEQSKKRKYMFIAGPLVLFITLFGLTYAFFNYTRTGTVNNLGTGQIYFNTTEGPTLNLTNVFPMTSTEAGNANLDSVSVVIEGNTTYSDGEEYEITLVDVNNTVNGKTIPINYTATYTPNTDKVIGTASNDYWNAREDKDANIYLLNATGKVTEGKQVLVGYVDNGATGIEGTLTIKAYIDKDKIAISDTYADNREYLVNSNMTVTEINDCVSYLTSLGLDEYLREGETLSAFCQGTGTLADVTLQDAIDQNLFEETQMSYLENHNIINNLGENGTTSEWVAGRTVLTTSEWNSLSSTPLSFKIRAESNEGIWVEAQAGAPTMAEMCPECVFAYSTTRFFTTWNTNSQTPSVLTSSDYSTNYEDVITSSGKNYFLGLKLNGSNQIEKAYACGLYNGTMPFCIEGYFDETKYEANKTILQDAGFWNNTCSVEMYYEGTEDEYETYCAPPTTGMVDAYIYFDGSVHTGVIGDFFRCLVYPNGIVTCDIVK